MDQALSSGQLLVKTGLSEYINKMTKDFIGNRLLYGLIGKRAKGKVKKFQKRFLMLISAKPLYPDNYNDEKILSET